MTLFQQLLKKFQLFFQKKLVLIIGIHSPQKNTGISNAFDILIDGLKERGFSYDVVKIYARSQGSVGSFRVSHLINVFSAVANCWIKSIFCRNVYLQIAFSKLGFFRDFLIIWPAALLGKKVFVHVHTGAYAIFYNSQPKWMKFLIRITLERTYRIIVLGTSLRGQFSFSSKLLPRIVVIPNGLDIDTEPIETLTKNKNAENIFNILYLSNMIISKGYLDVLEACRLLREENIGDFHVDFCGEFISIADEINQDSPHNRESDFQYKIASWHLENFVTYHGPVVGEKKKDFLRNANVFILPTNYLWEGQPLSIIEALAFGIPVISTNYRAIPDQIIPGFNGLLVDYGSPQQIKDAILTIKNDSALYKKLSHIAREIYLEKFTQQKHLDLLIPLITQ